MNKSFAYCLTRNIYHKVIPSIRSLTHFNDVDRIYLLIEDDTFPYELPEQAVTINVSDQPYFRHDGPNYNQRWTYMVLMRAALTKYLTDEERVLSLDVDTIIRGDIGALWDIDLTSWYLAGVREPYWSSVYKRLYVNMGVVMFNLDQLRRDGMDDRIIDVLNTEQHNLNEQDVINKLCARRMLEVAGRYNANPYTAHDSIVLIKHYAGTDNWYEMKEAQEWLKQDTPR